MDASPTAPRESTARRWDRPELLRYAVLSITLAFLVLHVMLPPSTTWNDEVTYQTAAQDILSGDKCSPGDVIGGLPVISSCNPEHPPLVKVLIAVSSYAFGGSITSARLVILLLGAATIPLVSFIAWRFTRSSRAAFLAGLLTAIDPLFYYMSSFAMLDVPEVFFTVTAFALYVAEPRVLGGRYKKFLAVGALVGLSTLAKEVGILALGALVTYHVFFSGSRARLRETATALVAAIATVVIGLQLFDSFFTTFPSFIDHLEYMYLFGDSLTKANAPFSVFFSSPDIWFLPVYIPRFTPPLSLMVAPLVFVWAPLALVKLRHWRNADARAFAFALVWLLWTYIPYLYLYSLGRSEYYFYSTQCLPPLVLGASLLLSSRHVPRVMIPFYLAACIVWVALFFQLGIMSGSLLP